MEEVENFEADQYFYNFISFGMLLMKWVLQVVLDTIVSFHSKSVFMELLHQVGVFCLSETRRSILVKAKKKQTNHIRLSV
ncbi:hypothetical protein L1987_03170 [Smallanthus sonchifolius]|uniref:Uncharacterized protein n=1 Tax=Smallanthus sonchifolius TaxID=185202 RepID=A0ACB9K9U3_9ASTR|nr:hypothetical protein L1987_03170 [Smallanthus sonchifolius]